MSVFVAVSKSALIHVSASTLPAANSVLAWARRAADDLLSFAKCRVSRAWSNQVMPPGTTTTGLFLATSCRRIGTPRRAS
eukprot:9994130-Alexandrium_andersonii.AAC.1